MEQHPYAHNHMPLPQPRPTHDLEPPAPNHHHQQRQQPPHLLQHQQHRHEVLPPPPPPPEQHFPHFQQQQSQPQRQRHTPLPHPESRPSRQTLPPSADITGGMLDRLDRPFKLPHYPPPSYAQTHDPNPAAPLGPSQPFADSFKPELAPIKSLNLDVRDNEKTTTTTTTTTRDSPHSSSITNGNNHTLPSLSSLTAAVASAPPPVYQPSHSHLAKEPAHSSPAPPPLTHWPSTNPLTAYYNPSHAQNADSPMRMDLDSSSNSGLSASSSDRLQQDGRASSVSLDDPDVRMAAEALGDLKADFVSSPSNRHTSMSASPHSRTNETQSEPLFSLLTTSHPFLANTIEGATSAYNSSKNYSPRFKSGAEYVEGYVIPIANTVGSVGRVTGVENGVRWFLTRHQSHHPDFEADREEQGSSKRRRVDSGSSTVRDNSPEPGSGAQTPRAALDTPHSRRLSVASTVDTLPAYDEFRSPPYAEHFAPPERQQSNSPWQSRLIMSTSGLSIAMSEESLRSLKYCLSWLRWANIRIGNVVQSLKTTMERYEQTKPGSGDDDHTMQGSYSHADTVDRNQLAARITELRSDVLKTLQDVINTVSRYAGGALPENARELVRRHLTSLPQRFRVANMVGRDSQDAGRNGQFDEEKGQERQEKETRENAQRVLLLAKEGLDMMSQVSGVLNGTIISAEEWCDRLGRRKREQREDLLGIPHPQVPFNDAKTG